MKRHADAGDSKVAFVIQGKPVFSSEHELNALIDVQQADAKTAGLYGIGTQLFKEIFLELRAGIADANEKQIAAFFHGQRDLILVIHAGFHAVTHSIFHQRLNDHLGYDGAQQRFVYHFGELHAVFVTELLNGNIAVNQIEFFT